MESSIAVQSEWHVIYRLLECVGQGSRPKMTWKSLTENDCQEWKSMQSTHSSFFFKNMHLLLIDFSLSVKVATLIFININMGVVWLFHLLRKGNQVLFII